MQAQFLRIGSQAIAFYQSAGTGPAALLVHGNSSSARSFRHQLAGSAGTTLRLVAIDLPGHGESAPASDPEVVYSLGGYVDVVVGVAEQLGLTRAVFVGWSLGGHIVLEAATRLPHAAGLMIFGTPPVAVPPTSDQAFLPGPALKAGFQPKLTDEEVSAYVRALFKPGADVPDLFHADVRRTDGRARDFLGRSIASGNYQDEVGIAAHLTIPLAILHGELEQIVNLNYLRTLAISTLWRGAVQMIADAGHAPHWEQPEQFNALLEAFLRDIQK